MHQFIVIEGNIGAGKTSLATRLADDYMARLVLERFTDNPFLPRFYEDQKRFAFSVELSFLADRYNQLKSQLTTPGLFSKFVIADYYFMKSLIFARVTLDDDEFRLFRQLFDIMNQSLPKPNLYVYLNSGTNKLLHNIKKRGRDFEKNISADYLTKISESYHNFFHQVNLPVLVININPNFDFVNSPEHYERLKSLIFNENYKTGVNHVEI